VRQWQGATKDLLVQELSERLQLVAETGSPSPVTDCTVVGRLVALGRIVTGELHRGGCDTALRLLEAVHRIRYQILPESQDEMGLRAGPARALRYLRDADAIDPRTQSWAAQVTEAPRETILTANSAGTARKTGLPSFRLSLRRATYGASVSVEISTNPSRRWRTSYHPDQPLARSLQRKADHTLRHRCRLRSYLTSTRHHDEWAVDALTCNVWMPRPT
jgi:hypothetical protein